MKDIVMIGAGKIGAIVAGLLASTGDYKVTPTDRSPEVLGNLDRDERIRIVAADVEDSLKLVDLLNGQFAVLNAAPFHLAKHIAEAARAAGTHYLDLTEDVVMTPQRFAPARSPGCVERYFGARGTNDPAGCGDHLCHRQRPQERPSRSGNLRKQDLQPRCGRPDIERHSNHDGRRDQYGPRSARDRPTATERVHPSGGHTAEGFLREPFR